MIRRDYPPSASLRCGRPKLINLSISTMNLDLIKDYLWNEYDIDNDYDLDKYARHIWENLDLSPVYSQIELIMSEFKVTDEVY